MAFFLCDVKVKREHLFWYTKPQLRILRNTIYAFHGYNFKSEDLKSLFSPKGRYWAPQFEPNPDFSEDLLSDIEKSNVKTLLEEEKSRDVYK